MSDIQLYLGDCLEVMNQIPDNSIDMVLCDLPYGTTACKWDRIIPFEPLWEQYNRICKNHSPIILFGREPFTSIMVASNIKNYKHKWVWNKKQSGSFFNAKFMPLQIEEDIVVFSPDKGGGGNKVNYYPILRDGKLRKRGGASSAPKFVSGGLKEGYSDYSSEYYPTNILEFPNCSHRKDRTHPTQKPVELCEYLIKTYSQEGETVLDNCMGSGTTGVACIHTGRNFIGIEKEEKYFEIAKKRIEDERKSFALWE